MNRRQALSRAGLIATSLAVLPGSVRPPRARDNPGDPSDDQIARWLRLANVPSMSLVRVDRDRVSTRAVGVLRKGEPGAVNADTAYAAASLTKSVFAYTFLSFVEEGAISLDRPLREYLPLPNPSDVRAQSMTARHLLSHSGGWRNWRNSATDELTAAFVPGTKWQYSGEGFFFLQRVLEKLTGKAVGTLARERVFAPLGMSRSSLLITEAIESQLASPHGGDGEVRTPYGRAALEEMRRAMAAKGATLDEVKVEDAEAALRATAPSLPLLPNYLSPNAAASLITTAADFGRFLSHLVTARAAGGRPAAIVAQMLSPQVRCNEAIQWGLGAGIETANGSDALWQWGDNPGYKNFYFANPTTGQAIALFTNGDRGQRVYERVIRAVTDADRAAFLFL